MSTPGQNEFLEGQTQQLLLSIFVLGSLFGSTASSQETQCKTCQFKDILIIEYKGNVLKFNCIQSYAQK